MKKIVKGLILVALLYVLVGFAYEAFQDSYFQLLYQSEVVLKRSIIEESDKSDNILGRTDEIYLVSVYVIKPASYRNRFYFGWGNRNSRQCLEFVKRRGGILLGFAGFAFPDQKLADLITANHKIKKILSLEDKKVSDMVTPNVKIKSKSGDYSFTKDDFSVPCFVRNDPDFGQDPNTFFRGYACTNAWGDDVAILCIVKK
jgi:hypothetical protein